MCGEKYMEKQAVFFDLPYLSILDVRYCLDVIHVEKNLCNSLIVTLLNIQGKTKDDKNCSSIYGGDCSILKFD